MYKPLLLAGVLLAQVAVPMGPRSFAVPPPDPTGPADGITVTGSGSASAQASSALVTLHISARNGAMTLNAQTLQPVVDALVRAGADRSSVVLPPYLVGPAHTNNASITARVDHPTLTMLQQGMLTIAGAFASMPDILLNDAVVQLSNDDCASLQRSAEAHAIADARANAQFIAKEIGAQTGNVVAIAGRTAPGPDACTNGYSIGPYSAPSQLSPAQLLTITVYSNVSMRFAIKR